jgi:hypothetical protein
MSKQIYRQTKYVTYGRFQSDIPRPTGKEMKHIGKQGNASICPFRQSYIKVFFHGWWFQRFIIRWAVLGTGKLIHCPGNSIRIRYY